MKITKTDDVARRKAARHSMQHGWAYCISVDGNTVTYHDGNVYRVDSGVPINVIGCGEDYYMSLSEARALGIR